MVKKRKSKPNPDIQTGRALPQNIRVSSYSPRKAVRHPDDLTINRDDETYAEPRRKPRWRKVTTRTILLIFLLALAAILTIGIWDARNISSASQKMFGSGNLLALVNSNGLKTADDGRVNVLVAGYSVDDPGHQGADLTDSILLLSMNPSNHTGYMLSIPRDLYVKIPGFGHAKINEAYKDGGMSLLEQVVESDFDTQINYYALVDYSAVRDVVNALGGVNVTISSPDGRLYDPNKDWTTGEPLVDLNNGPHHLNGQQALDLTRARGDSSPYGYSVGFEQSDFQRTADQRLVFTSIKNKLNWKLILNPKKNSQILNAVADNVKTNVTIGEARPLFSLFNNIPSSQLKSLSLRDINGKTYVEDTYYEGSTQSPAAGINDFSEINSALQQFNE
ncbi:MAG TPA: LCP family protein [Candidatus Saccharimonadales bacterium]|nr:LCP family protein [Candidatus Saccharimonadales bacterium]